MKNDNLEEQKQIGKTIGKWTKTRNKKNNKRQQGEIQTKYKGLWKKECETTGNIMIHDIKPIYKRQ